jgi:hypothetical protein
LLSNSYAAKSSEKVEEVVSSFAEDLNAAYPLNAQTANFKSIMDKFYSDFRSYLSLYFDVYEKLPPIVGSDAIKDLDEALKGETGTTVRELNEKMKALTRTIDEKISPEIFKYLAREKYKAQHKLAKQSAATSKSKSKKSSSK